jgi:phage tail sheath protein FI
VRIVQTLKRAIDIALRWVVFEPNDDATRSDVAAVLTAILTMFFERGAFAGASAEESFYVRCDDDTTPQDQRDNGRLVALIGIAPAAPAEFIVLRVGRQDNLPVVTLLERGAVAAREGAFA